MLQVVQLQLCEQERAFSVRFYWGRNGKPRKLHRLGVSVEKRGDQRMGIPVLILGESGSGKSASMRNFSPDHLGIINVSGKPLPFRGNFKMAMTDDYQKVIQVLLGSKVKSIVIDDCQYLMVNEFMRNAKVNGYQKFTDIALNFWTLVQTVIYSLPSDVIVYFLGHVERDGDGREKLKTVGKLTDEKVTIEGYFTIVLKTLVQDQHYYFTTQTNGMDTVKSPMGMFEQQQIDNDLKMVDDTIRAYYNLTESQGEIS